MRCAPVVVVSVLLLAGSASAEEQKGHKGQGVANLQVGTGYRAIFPFDEEYCGQLDEAGANKSNCVGRSPVVLGLQLGYGVTESLEVFAELGIGLETDVGDRAAPEDGPRPFFFAPGVRAYIAELGPTRLFSSLQFVIDFTDFAQVEGNDLAVRNLNGLQLDLHPTFGTYVYFGESVGFRRWLGFTVEAGIGLQARFP